jgi:hypothetical protein
VVETAAEFFKQRAGSSDGSGLMGFLRRAPAAKPDVGDEL